MAVLGPGMLHLEDKSVGLKQRNCLFLIWHFGGASFGTAVQQPSVINWDKVQELKKA